MPKARYCKTACQACGKKWVGQFSDLHSVNKDLTNLDMAQGRSDYYFYLPRNA